MSKTVLITGASKGIGRATALTLAKKGYSLFLLARRQNELEELKNEILSNYPQGQVTIASIDMSLPENIESFFQSNIGEVSKIDVLVNNAGCALGMDKVQEAQFEDWNLMLQTNVTGLFKLTHLLLPFLVKNPQSYIINIGSVAGHWTYPGGAVYCATKAAIKSFSEGLRLDTMGTGLRVTNVEPGMVKTDFSIVRMGDIKKANDVYKDMTPLKPEDIANCILWCLEQPAHVNVQELIVFPTDQAGVGHVHRQTSHL